MWMIIITHFYTHLIMPLFFKIVKLKYIKIAFIFIFIGSRKFKGKLATLTISVRAHP